MKWLLWFHSALAVMLGLNLFNALLGLAGVGYTRIRPGEFFGALLVFLITAAVAWGGWHFHGLGKTGSAQLLLGLWWLAVLALIFWAAAGARWN